jgi:periplasmic copper chaperone A
MLLCCTLGSHASMQTHAENVATVQVGDAWSRPTPPGIGVGAVYLSIKNSGAAADRLLSASSPLAAKIEFHQSTQTGGVLSMRPLSFIECPAGVTVKVSPGGLHIMLLGLRDSLVLGSSFPITLQFRDAGNIPVKVTVQARE